MKLDDIILIIFVIACVLYLGLLELRVSKLEKKIAKCDTITDLLIYDFIKRNKKNIKGIKLDKDAVDELFK